MKMYFGGIWFLLTDSGKSSLTFRSEISSFGQTRTFRFDDLGDYGLFYEVFISDPYHIDESAEPQLIFDVGANIGVATLYFNMRFPQAVIHSFEPDPSNYSRLTELASNCTNITTHEAAVWSEDTRLTFYSDPHRGSSSSSRKIRNRQKETTVQARSMHSICEELQTETIDILKFDIEGAEEEVFDSFKDLSGIGILLGEIHGDLCNGDEVVDLIESQFSQVTTKPFNDGHRLYISAVG